MNRLFLNTCLKRKSCASLCRQYSPSTIRPKVKERELGWILNQVSTGKLTPSESEEIIRRQFNMDLTNGSLKSPDEILNSFAEIDHTRSSRTGFPEAVFGAGKTPNQIAIILDDMARYFNDKVKKDEASIKNCERAILATR